MRIAGSSIQFTGKSKSVEKQTKVESLKMWIGNTRPDFAGEKPVGPFILSENSQQGDILQLSAKGKAALEKQMTATPSCGNCEEDMETSELSEKDKQKIFLLQKMIEALTGKKFKFILPKRVRLNIVSSDALSIRTGTETQSTPAQKNQGWGLEYDLQETRYEKQTMVFLAKGTVKTADGKEISLDLELSMSREFASRLAVSVRAGDAVKVDPLVVNYGGSAAALTNSKFSFDIDADGGNEQISFAAGGSGFLAFDINNDGAINNGSELFGPLSGNGFNDLAQYDEDGNGWIDESDDVYSKLRIWTKDENGNDKLFALGVKDIGAIYLGNAATAFDIKTGSNQTLGSIARSGIFLRENGLAGTIHHVDLVV